MESPVENHDSPMSKPRSCLHLPSQRQSGFFNTRIGIFRQFIYGIACGCVKRHENDYNRISSFCGFKDSGISLSTISLKFNRIYFI